MIPGGEPCLLAVTDEIGSAQPGSFETIAAGFEVLSQL